MSCQVTLDGEKPSSQELGTIAVRVAMLKSRRSREQKQSTVQVTVAIIIVRFGRLMCCYGFIISVCIFVIMCHFVNN